jgi:hypothetical protein
MACFGTHRAPRDNAAVDEAERLYQEALVGRYREV